MHWSLITLAQLSLSASVGALTLPVLAILPYKPIDSLAQLNDTVLLAYTHTHIHTHTCICK
jgi:hypothetical protein